MFITAIGQVLHIIAYTVLIIEPQILTILNLVNEDIIIDTTTKIVPIYPTISPLQQFHQYK